VRLIETLGKSSETTPNAESWQSALALSLASVGDAPWSGCAKVIENTAKANAKARFIDTPGGFSERESGFL
jgi:hypothetical protein